MSAKEVKAPNTAQSSGVGGLEETCTRCGKQAHIRKECQAIGHKCTKCNKKNHYEDLCNPEAPVKIPAYPKSTKQTGQQASKNQTVQHQTKAVQQPSKAAPPKTVQPSSGSKPEAQKPADATPAAAKEKPVMTLKFGEEVGVKRRDKPVWVKGAKIVNVLDEHYEVKWPNGEKERFFWRYVEPLSAFDVFGNLKPKKVRDAEADNYFNKDLVLEVKSHVRVRAYDSKNFDSKGTIAGRAGDHYLIAYGNGSSAWEYLRFVKSEACFDEEGRLIPERKERPRAESVGQEWFNPELVLEEGTEVAVRDLKTKKWEHFGTVVGRSGNSYLVQWADGGESWEFHHFVVDSSLVDEKGLKKPMEEAAPIETKAEPVVPEEKKKSDGKLQPGTRVWFWNPETRNYSNHGNILKYRHGKYLIESKTGKWATQTWENEGSVHPVYAQA